MTPRLSLFVWLLVGAAACGPSDPSPVEAEIQTDATIRWQEIEGGFFGIVADDGTRYDPVNLPGAFRQDGLRVRIEATPARRSSIHMWGSPIEILSIRALETSGGDAPAPSRV
jgi:hypothetical protein